MVRLLVIIYTIHCKMQCKLLHLNVAQWEFRCGRCIENLMELCEDCEGDEDVEKDRLREKCNQLCQGASHTANYLPTALHARRVGSVFVRICTRQSFGHSDVDPHEIACRLNVPFYLSVLFIRMTATIILITWKCHSIAGTINTPEKISKYDSLEIVGIRIVHAAYNVRTSFECLVNYQSVAENWICLLAMQRYRRVFAVCVYVFTCSSCGWLAT